MLSAKSRYGVTKMPSSNTKQRQSLSPVVHFLHPVIVFVIVLVIVIVTVIDIVVINFIVIFILIVL